MKVMITSLLVLSASISYAQLDETKCELKSKNAASYQLAQEIAAPVQQVEVLLYQPGPWTEAFGNNTGFNIVQVKVKDFTKRYMTFGQQIESSTDCRITKVIEDKLARPQ
jgi:hypothetical protein